MTQDDLYSAIAKKYDLSFIEARRICNSGWGFVRNRIRHNDPKPILLAGLCRFKMKPSYEAKQELYKASKADYEESEDDITSED